MLSFRRSIVGVVWGIAVSSAVQAASPYLPADTKDTQKLVADRISFVKANYQLDDASLKRVSDWISSQAATQERYQADTHKSSYRINLAMTIVRGDSTIQPADRTDRLNTLQAQLGRILSRAPLSLANVMKNAESGLAPDKVAAARQRLQTKLAQPRIDTEMIDTVLVTPATTIAKLDAPPPAPPSTPPAQQAAATGHEGHSHAPGEGHAHTPTPPNPAQSTPQKSQPPVQQPLTPPVVQTPAQPPPPPKNLPPAPPEAEWSAYTMKTADKYNFTPDQKRAALNVLKHVRDRAAAHRESKKTAYEEAAKTVDAKSKSEKISELNKPLDAYYDELVQRIDNIASVEQKNKAAMGATTQKS